MAVSIFASRLMRSASVDSRFFMISMVSTSCDFCPPDGAGPAAGAAVVFAAGSLTLYVDGMVAGADETSIYPQDLGVTTNNWLGDSQWEGDDFYDGLLDEFRIYDRALSAGEIRYLAGDN